MKLPPLLSVFMLAAQTMPLSLFDPLTVFPQLLQLVQGMALMCVMVIPATSTTSSDLHKQPGKNGKQPKDQQPKGPLELAETDKLFCSSVHLFIVIVVEYRSGGIIFNTVSIMISSKATIFSLYYNNPGCSKPSHRHGGKMPLTWSVQLVIW